MTSSSIARPEKKPAGTPSPAQKAAVVLASLPREAARSIVAEIGDEHLGVMLKAIAKLTPMPPEARQSIVKEFVMEVARRAAESPNGDAAASKFLSEITDKARSDKILAAAATAGDDAGDLWARVAALPVDRLLPFLLEQRTPTAAAILINLPVERSAAVLAAAPTEFSQTITSAIARLQQTDGAVKEAIARVIEADLMKAPAQRPENETVSELAVDILDFLPSTTRGRLIEGLRASDGAMAASIEKALLTFEGLPERLTEAAVAALVRTVERETLLCAMKRGEINAPGTVEFLLANISKRMAEQFREELQASGVPSEADGEAAQRAVVGAVKTLERSGEFKLKKPT